MMQFEAGKHWGYGVWVLKRERFCKMHFLGSVGERVGESYKGKVPAMRVALKELRNELDLGSVSAGIP